MEFKQPERRKRERRQTKGDRREMIRFEMDKTPRRSGLDRRKSNVWKGRENF